MSLKIVPDPLATQTQFYPAQIKNPTQPIINLAQSNRPAPNKNKKLKKIKEVILLQNPQPDPFNKPQAQLIQHHFSFKSRRRGPHTKKNKKKKSEHQFQLSISVICAPKSELKRDFLS